MHTVSFRTILADRYELREMLGEGAYGRVFQARHIHLERTVAVKVMHPHLAGRPHLVRRFRREARMLSRIRHPNVVNVLDFEAGDERLFLAMEFLEGPTLRERMRNVDPISIRSLVRMLRGLTSGLRAIHSVGLVHRDIKPSNVLLARVQGEECPVLIDFGLATVGAEDSHMSVLTAADQLIGTPLYMSPEAARGERPGPASDLYALGIIAWEILCGRPPFESETVIGMLRKHEREEPPSVVDHALFETPSQLADLVGGLLSKSPAMRPSVAQCLNTLETLDDALRDAAGLPAAGDAISTSEARSDLSAERQLAALARIARNDSASAHRTSRSHESERIPHSELPTPLAPPSEETLLSMELSDAATGERDPRAATASVDRSAHEFGELATRSMNLLEHEREDGAPQRADSDVDSSGERSDYRACDTTSVSRRPPTADTSEGSADNPSPTSLAPLRQRPQERTTRRRRPGHVWWALALTALVGFAAPHWLDTRSTDDAPPSPIHVEADPSPPAEIPRSAGEKQESMTLESFATAMDHAREHLGRAHVEGVVTMELLHVATGESGGWLASLALPRLEAATTRKALAAIRSSIPADSKSDALDAPTADGSSEADTVPAPADATVPATPRRRAPGTLAVTILPWGDVSVDGESVGSSPIRSLELAPGTYDVRVDHAEQEFRETVRIRSGERTLVRHRFD